MKRRKARELILKILYQSDIKKESVKSILKDFWKNHNDEDEEIKEFVEKVAIGTEENIEFIDNLISKISKNWELGRMSYIDRNILRFATYEIFFMEDIPPVVSINEAIEIAKKFGGEESPKFINGILHKVKEEKEVRK
ncbi:MAG: transcription antitermination factor NusB [Candidatus Omnitrophota bacterium]|nr:MAG: transcription antitermination factor NusB [Candidatus Omnitrophota bacterium]